VVRQAHHIRPIILSLSKEGGTAHCDAVCEEGRMGRE